MAWETLDDFMRSPVEARKSKVGRQRKIKSVVNRTPEVMVKISGNAKGGDHVGSHLLYISRNGKLEVETEQGEVINSNQGMKEKIKEWQQDLGKRTKKTRDTVNIVLSMPAGTDPIGLKKAARQFAKNRFAENHQYVFALHTDVDHPHVHLTVKSLGFDGTRLHVKRGDPQIWREEFAEQLRVQGIDAEATPRKVRGVVKKPTSQPVFHLRKRGQAQTDKEKIKEIVADFKDGQRELKPWEVQIQATQTKVRKAWLKEAQELQSAGDNVTAKKVVDFVNSMPPIDTERQTMAMRLARVLENENAKTMVTEKGRGEER